MVASLRQALVANITFPLSSFLMNRRHVMTHYRQLVTSQWREGEQIRELQLAKLKSTISRAYNHSPFYKKRFDEIGLQPGDIRSLSDIKAIPPVTRQDVIDYVREMVDSRLEASVVEADNSTRGPGIPIPLAVFKKHQLVKNTSSGSTGAPTAFYENGSQTALNWAHELRFRNWFGISPGAPEARMARVSKEFIKNSLTSNIRKLLWNQLPLPGIDLDETSYRLIHDQLEKFRPSVIWGFTSAIVGFAEYLRDQNISAESFAPRLIITWAAPFYDHENELLQKVFNCDTTNIYGLREIGHVAARCPKGEFHINHENILLESESGTGEATELLGTGLDAHAMPFIRYRTGDLGVVGQSKCVCGLKLPVLEKFVGRTGEVFYNKEGKMIAPNFWCRFFMNGQLSGKVHRFQVLYKKDKNIDLTLVKGGEFNGEAETIIRDKFYEAFTPQTHLNIKYTDKIMPSISGKYQMVVKE